MKILISGYYGFGNLGDEAILSVLTARLQERFPGVELVVLSQNPELTARRNGVRAIGRWNFLAIESELKSADLFISGGGGLLQDRTSWRSPLYYLALIKLAKRHCPVVMLGQGIGPIERGWVRLLTWKAIEAVDFAFLRDQKSCDELITAGVAESQAISGSDLVMLEWPEWTEVRESDVEATNIGVSLTSSFPVSRVEHLAHQLDQIYELHRLRTIFLIFNEDQDRAISQQVAGQMQSNPLIFSPSVSESQECYSQLRYVIGMRYHSLIYATLAARPFISLVNDPKQTKLISQLQACDWGEPEICQIELDELESKNLANLVENLEAANGDLRNLISKAGLKLFTDTNEGMERSCREIATLLKLD